MRQERATRERRPGEREPTSAGELSVRTEHVAAEDVQVSVSGPTAVRGARTPGPEARAGQPGFDAEAEAAGEPGVVPAPPALEVQDLRMAYGDRVVMQEVGFKVRRGEIFVIMGGSGSGKSTLLKHLIGLKKPAAGTILFDGEDFGEATPAARRTMLRRMGVLYQNGALWSGLTLAENVALPLEEYTALNAEGIAELVSLKLALVGLRGFEAYYPVEISGGMRKRAALARAIALDPEILFLDEPSSGLDPITASRLDDLILQLRDSFGTTLVVVSHDLDSIFKIADRALFLDIAEKTMTALGDPVDLRDHPPSEEVHRFLTRSSGGDERPADERTRERIAVP
jgi:phospholipid/cholesterol/gamma-HCH transport system ATP-binding protein